MINVRMIGSAAWASSLGMVRAGPAEFDQIGRDVLKAIIFSGKATESVAGACIDDCPFATDGGACRVGLDNKLVLHGRGPNCPAGRL